MGALDDMSGEDVAALSALADQGDPDAQEAAAELMADVADPNADPERCRPRSTGDQ